MEKQKNFQRTFELAADELRRAGIDHLHRYPGIMMKAGNAGGTAIELPFFGRRHTIIYPDCTFTGTGDAAVSLAARIIILHFLRQADNPPVFEELVNYGRLPGAGFYFPVFKRKSTDQLAAKLGNDMDAFRRAGRELGGREEDLGDASFILPALPGFELTLVAWEGDEDFPPAYDILFDRAIARYLSWEDIVVLAQMAAKRVIARAAVTPLKDTTRDAAPGG
ncbi:MAG: DUF3786 domain-containing protein [Deltaproteobacteria bacterium]|nr:DUF3786 domain-containing protein [Candidatus Anaeroferrophillacea bacterium]